MNSEIKAVILAGGQGTRFWPISRLKQPKQFLALANTGQSLIQATAQRVVKLCGDEGLYVVAGEQHAALIREHVPSAKLLLEPLAKNTAASIGLAAIHLQRSDPQSVMLVLPADHTVSDQEGLHQALQRAVQVAKQQEMLVTLGIRPAFPHTGYGYMRRGGELADGSYRVTRFYEKPNLERARMYVESGEFFWNSGMFVWRVDVILKALAEHMPDLYRGLQELEAALGKKDEQKVCLDVFAKLDSISIDFGVLELAKNCALVDAGDFGWSDVGSWDAWAEHLQADAHGNVAMGDNLLLDSTGCIVKGSKRLIALLGARDLVVIDSEDALLVCPRRRVQDVKLLVDELKKKGRSDLI